MCTPINSNARLLLVYIDRRRRQRRTTSRYYLSTPRWIRGLESCILRLLTIDGKFFPFKSYLTKTRYVYSRFL